MRNPYSVLITGCTGLPAEVTLGAPCNDSGFLSADHQLEEQSPCHSVAQHPLGQRTPLPPPWGSLGNALICAHSSLLQCQARDLTELWAKAILAPGDSNLPSQAGESQIFSFPAFPIIFLSKQLFTGVGSL